MVKIFIFFKEKEKKYDVLLCFGAIILKSKLSVGTINKYHFISLMKK